MTTVRQLQNFGFELSHQISAGGEPITAGAAKQMMFAAMNNSEILIALAAARAPHLPLTATEVAAMSGYSPKSKQFIDHLSSLVKLEIFERCGRTDFRLTDWSRKILNS